MSMVSLVPAQKNLIGEIVPLLSHTGRDYSRNIVVFPGKRPAHALRKLLAQREGGSFLPPRIFSIDNFIDYLCLQKLKFAEKNLEALDAAALLHEIYLNDTGRIGSDHFTSFDSFLPLGMKIFGELEELWIANIPLARVRDALSGITFGGLTSLLVFYEQFYALAGDRTFITRSMKYRVVAENIAAVDFSDWSKIIFAGFFAFTTSEKIILRHLNSLDNVALIFQSGPGIGARLKELGVSTEVPPQASSEPTLYFYRSADTHGQVFALTKKIDELKKEKDFSFDRTAIALPSAETLFPVFHQTLALLPDNEYNISLGYPLTRTPVYGFLETLMELVISKYEQRYSVSQYMKFVLHPYTKNIRYGARSDITRILFNTIEEFFLREHSAGYFSLEELENNTSLFERAAKRVAGGDERIPAESLKSHLISIHANTARVYDAIENIGMFATTTTDVLSYINAHSTAQLHPFFRPFAEAVIECLDAVSTSLVRDRRFDEFVEYVSFLRNYVAAAEVPFTGTPLHGLQVLGFLETRNLQFDKVFILDANDDVLPGNKGHDVLLPMKLRESLGLSTYRESERMAEYYFDVLLQGSKEVHLFFIQDGKKEKSRYVEKLLWKKEQQEKTIDSGENFQTLRYRIQLANGTPTPILKTEAVASSLKDFSFNATALDAYLKCELRFYYAYVLQLREREEISGELDQADVGIFVHAVLAAYFRKFRDKKLEKDALTVDALEKTIDELFTKEYGSDPLGPAYLLKKQFTRHLRDFLKQYQLPKLNEDVTLLDVELKLDSSMNGHRFGGKLDRVERRSGKIYILDYKTGSNEKYTRVNFKKLQLDNRDSWSESIGSLQLPLYAMLYAKATGMRGDEIMPAFLFLGKQKIDEKIEEPLYDASDSPAEKFALLGKIIFGLVDEITSAAYPFEPTKNIERECRSCSFKYVCGTQWVR
ncbi:MAG: PD-(D/E)XK nuclease family protein [Bacteroidota bacterium]